MIQDPDQVSSPGAPLCLNGDVVTVVLVVISTLLLHSYRLPTSQGLSLTLWLPSTQSSVSRCCVPFWIKEP